MDSIPNPLNPELKIVNLNPATATMFASAVYPCVIEFTLKPPPGTTTTESPPALMGTNMSAAAEGAVAVSTDKVMEGVVKEVEKGKEKEEVNAEEEAPGNQNSGSRGDGEIENESGAVEYSAADESSSIAVPDINESAIPDINAMSFVMTEKGDLFEHNMAGDKGSSSSDQDGRKKVTSKGAVVANSREVQGGAMSMQGNRAAGLAPTVQNRFITKIMFKSGK
jgi:hypothetical protein